MGNRSSSKMCQSCLPHSQPIKMTIIRRLLIQERALHPKGTSGILTFRVLGEGTLEEEGVVYPKVV